jgi:WD40 repeat protein
MLTRSHTGPTIVTVSRDGDRVVRVHGKEVSVHSAIPIEGSRFLRSIKLQEPFGSQLKFVKISWSDSASDDAGTRMQTDDEGPLDLVSHQRLLCATSNRISVWQLNSLEWHADIDNIEPNVTAIDFGSNAEEAILFHAWSSKVTIFNLETASSLVIKSPKFCSPSSQGHGYRPQTKQLAILLKPEASDLLTIHEAHSYETISKVNLPTVDAQGLNWSPDGRWIAVWDAASNGTKVLIYTADGQHFRTYTGRSDVGSTHDLGVKCIEWAPLKPRQQNSEVLAIGKYDGTVDLLNTRTVWIPFCNTFMNGAKNYHSSHVPPHFRTPFKLTSNHPESGENVCLPTGSSNMSKQHHHLHSSQQATPPPSCHEVCHCCNSHHMVTSLPP